MMIYNDFETGTILKLAVNPLLLFVSAALHWLSGCGPVKGGINTASFVLIVLRGK